MKLKKNAIKMNSFNHVGDYKKGDFLVMGGGGADSAPQLQESPGSGQRPMRGI